MRSVVIHSRTNFYFPCKQQSVTIAFLFILQTRSTVHKWQILQFELINNLSCFVITRTHVIHTNETNTLNLYKRYKKEINNLIDGTLLLSFLIPLIMYIESLLLMVIVLIIPFNVFFFWFCKQENEFNADDDLYNDVITAPSSGDNAEVNL